MIHPIHWAVFLSNKANKLLLVHQLLSNKVPVPFEAFQGLKVALFSAIALQEFMAEEERHQFVAVSAGHNRQLRFLSNGEQKKALLEYLLLQMPDFIIADNPMDNLDFGSQAELKTMLTQIGERIPIIQLVNRQSDCLAFIQNAVGLNDKDELDFHGSVQQYFERQSREGPSFEGNIPASDYQYALTGNTLVEFRNVSVKYDERIIVKDICWQINVGEFWQLIGPNGCGKSTLLSLITGDNPKGYGQDLLLFGKKKGTGESVWSIKQKIGYFTSAINDLFSGHSSVEHMILSGFFDSIGLYVKPSSRQISCAQQWLVLIGMSAQKNKLFNTLSLGQQRMVLIVRAMVKHPPLLILDEPTAGLDDANAAIVVALINKLAADTTTAILYVSHRTEAGLCPNCIFELTAGAVGSIGEIKSSMLQGNHGSLQERPF